MKIWLEDFMLWMTSEFVCWFWKLVSLQRSAIGNDTVGYNILKSHSLPTDDYWYWIGVAVLLAYSVLFNNLVTFALAYLNRMFERIYIYFF